MENKPGPKQPNPETLARFREAYLENGLNAYRAAIQIGMKPNTARAHAHRYARLVNVELKHAATALGLTAEYVAGKLKQLCEAKTVKWNPQKFPATRGHKGKKGTPARGGWDTFDDGDLQLDAIRELNRIHDVYPAPKEVGDTSRPVMINFPPSFKSLIVETVDEPKKK